MPARSRLSRPPVLCSGCCAQGGDETSHNLIPLRWLTRVHSQCRQPALRRGGGAGSASFAKNSIGAPIMSHRSCARAFFLDTFPFRPAPSAAKSALMASSAHSISWKVTTWATRGSPGGLVRLVQAEEDRLRTPDERLAGQKLSRAAGGAV